MFIIYIIQFVTSCSISGNLQTPKHYPATNVQVEFENIQTISDQNGQFKLEVNSHVIDGILKFNIANDFEQELILKNQQCPVNLGKITLNNQKSVDTEIVGCVVQNDDKKPGNNSFLEIIYDQPTYLDKQILKVDQNGCFRSLDNLMKFLVYSAIIKVNQKGYLSLSTRTNLYGSYQQNLGNLFIQPDYYQVIIKISIENNCENLSKIQQQNSDKSTQSETLVSLSCGLTYKTKFQMQQDTNTYQLDLKDVFKKGFTYTCGILAQNFKCGLAYNVFTVQENKNNDINLSIGKKIDNQTQQNQTISSFTTKFIGKVVEMQSYSCSKQNPIADVEVKFFIEFTKKEFVNQTKTLQNGNFELIAQNPIFDGSFSGSLEFNKESYFTNQVDFTFQISQKNLEFQIGIIQLLNMKGVQDC